MRNIFLLSVLAVGTLLVTGALAQHEGHHPEEATAPADKSATTAAPAKDEMKGGMMDGMMGGMMAERAETAKLVDRLVAGFAAIEAEKDANALQAKLTEHGKLLKELQAKLQAESQMMENMHGKMMGDHKK